MELRYYQKQALEKIMWVMQSKMEGNDIIVLPTGAGKSVVIAHLAKELNQPILILQPSKEILEQNYAKLLQYVPAEDIGIYSASMGEKIVGHYTFATIQSIYKKPELFKHFKLVIVDECHLVNPKALGGMFTKFLREIGNPKVVGFTATPYRMDTGYMNYGTEYARVFTTIKLVNRMKGFFWKRLLFVVNTSELIMNGYLCQLEYVDRPLVNQEDIPLNISHSDFNMEAYETLVSPKEGEIMSCIAEQMQTAKSVLVFCSSVAQAHRFATIVPNSAAVSAKTPKKERDQIIGDFKAGKIKCVFNMGVLTTGFDHPALDCIILNRPTRSIALYYQMLGRGVRISPGKTACKVVDFTSTVKQLGRIETIKLIKEDKWELVSETGSWHGRELYSFLLKK